MNANPYLVLADVLVSLVFVFCIFLISTSLYSNEMLRVAQRNKKRTELSADVRTKLISSGLVAEGTEYESPPGSQSKWRLGDCLELEVDGSLQRYSFPSGLLDFEHYPPKEGRPQPVSDQKFVNEKNANTLLLAMGNAFLKNRSKIKSIVIEGIARQGEKDPWPVSQARAEKVRAIWTRGNSGTGESGIAADVLAVYSLPPYQWAQAHKSKSVEFSGWHIQEYLAKRRSGNQGLGVLPTSWIIVSGRGDSLERGASRKYEAKQLGSVEIKVEFTERSGPPLDEYFSRLPEKERKEVEDAGYVFGHEGQKKP